MLKPRRQKGVDGLPTGSDSQDEAEDGAITHSPAIVGLTGHFADKDVERRFAAAIAFQGRRRLVILCWVGVALSISRLLASVAGLAADPALYRSLPARLVQIGICIALLAILRRPRSPALLERLGAAFGISYIVIQCWLLPDMAGDGSIAMVIGTVALLLSGLPVRLSLLAPASIAGSAIMLFVWATQRPAPTHVALLQATEWLIVINLLGMSGLRMMRLTLRRQYALSETLRHLATHDALTAVANRRRYDHVLAREWARCREARQPLSLLLLDVDFFKLLNDHIGHAAGDDCLRELAGLLMRCVDQPAALVARTGGEEFACILPDTSPAEALQVAQCITHSLDRLGMPHPHSPIGPHITVSLGLATAWPAQGHTLGDLTGLADRLLYKAKAQGRACLRQQVITTTKEKFGENVPFQNPSSFVGAR